MVTEQTTACEHPVVPVEDGQHVIGIFVPAKHNAVALMTADGHCAPDRMMMENKLVLAVISSLT
jgi:hypothetical protein